MTLLRGIFIDPDKCTVEEIQVEMGDSFDPLYKLCHCDMIQVVTRHSNGREFHLFFDEEARLKKDRPTSFAIKVDELNGLAEEILGPTVILGGADRKGNTLPAPDWCTIENIQPLVLWSSQSHTEFPDHWLVKILMIGGGDSPRFSCLYMNPHKFKNVQQANPELSSKELNAMLDKEGATGLINYKPQDFGFSSAEFDDTIESAPHDELTMSIITATLESIRERIARDVLKIDPAKLFLMKEPLTYSTPAQEGKR